MENAVVSIFLAIISVVALIGNALVIALLLKKREWLKKAHSCLLLALAVQDTLTAIGLSVLPGFVLSKNAYKLPAGDWWRGQLYCSVIWSRYVPFSLAITSLYTCLMLAVDRYFAVFKPMSYRRFSTSGKVIATLVTLPWIAGFGIEINTALNVRYLEDKDISPVCHWNKIDTSPKSKVSAIFTFIGMIVLPAILMIIAYAKIIIQRRENAIRIHPQVVDLRRFSFATADHRQTVAMSSLKRLTKIAIATSAVVVLCWLPIQFYFCLFQIGLVEIGNSLHKGLTILAFLNICMNPFLYSFSNKQYSEEFETILCCMYHRERTESVSLRQRPT